MNGLIEQWQDTNSITSNSNYINYYVEFSQVPNITAEINEEESGTGIQIYVYSKTKAKCQIITLSVSGGSWLPRPISLRAIGY